MSYLARITGLILVGALASCTGEPSSKEVFSLPEGNAEQGKRLFADLGCNGCHVISGVDLPEPEGARQLEIVLGGKTTRARSEAYLVTSIINPSHKLPTNYPLAMVSKAGESRMPVYNDLLTVTNLVDLVAFLYPTFQVVRPRVRYEPFDYEKWQKRGQ
ncbi:MAG: hypothetical protein ACR2PZ_07700 [Pseudomonadales bacterium]